MADQFWRYAPDPRQQVAMVPAPQASLKRPRPDYPDMQAATEMLGYYSREDERTAPQIPRDTESMNASYERYLRNGLSSYPPANPIRPVAGGLTGRQVEDARLIGMDSRAAPFAATRQEAQLPPDASNTLFVEGLPANCTRREVSHIFRPFVGFREVRLVNKESRQAGGDPLVLCFVDFGTPSQAAIALDALQDRDSSIDGKHSTGITSDQAFADLLRCGLIVPHQVLGFGWAGIFRRYLVEPAAMWWPYNLVQVSLFRALHEDEPRPKGGMTRNQFFMVAFICSFSYYVFPGYLFQMLTSLSWICWIFPTSILAQQLGSGLSGLGIAAVGIDWSTISSYLGSPLASPWFATANVAVGFVLIMYVITPIAYWLNLYNAKTFPIFSDGLFTTTGQTYNITSIIDSDFHLDVEAYEKNGPLYLSTFFAMTYGVGFASLTATLMHVLLFHGKEIWHLSKSAFQEKKIDVHTRLMSKYNQVPEWWFICILIANIALTVFACEYYIDQLQLPWWGVLLACTIAIFFTLPIGIITATTNQTPGLNIITEYIIGYLYPGRPVANMCFKVYGYISMTQALTFLQDFKLGHYMKIPPRTMFMAQVVGTLIAAVVYLGTAWWLMDSITDICNTALLSSDSPWTCPSDHVFYDASVIWGLIGPRRIFGNLGTYSAINWFFLAGAIAPVLVWLAHRAFPNQSWIRLINMPVLIGATGMMPPATAVNYTTWIAVGFLSGFVVYRYRRDWWQRHNYVLSGALDAGLAFMAVVLYLCLGLENISLSWWGNELDGCPLATCPTARGVFVDGCPVS